MRVVGHRDNASPAVYRAARESAAGPMTVEAYGSSRRRIVVVRPLRPKASHARASSSAGEPTVRWGRVRKEPARRAIGRRGHGRSTVESRWQVEECLTLPASESPSPCADSSTREHPCPGGLICSPQTASSDARERTHSLEQVSRRRLTSRAAILGIPPRSAPASDRPRTGGTLMAANVLGS